MVVRGTEIPLPSPGDYAKLGVELEEPEEIQVFELCRLLAAIARDDVLATPKESRVSVLPGMKRILQLEEDSQSILAQKKSGDRIRFRTTGY